MAITFDNAGNSGGSGTSVSFSFTVGSGADVLLAGVWRNDTQTIGTATYGGQSMTAIDTFNIGTGGSTEHVVTFYLINPPKGSNTFAVSTTGSAGITGAALASYNGAAVVNTPDNHHSAGGSTGGTTSFSDSVTTIADNCWVWSFGVSASSNFAAGTATTSRSTNASFGFGVGDNNAAKTPAGSVTEQYTFDASSTYGIGLISLAPLLPVSVSVSDVITPSDAVSIAQVYFLSKTESTAVTDAVSVILALAISETEVVTMTDTLSPFSLPWRGQSKNISSWTAQSLNSSSWTDQVLHSSAFVNQTKS